MRTNHQTTGWKPRCSQGPRPNRAEFRREPPGQGVEAHPRPGGIGHRALKDLRDAFASQLLTAGVQLGYVSQQLGHADVSVTAKHYARWAGGDEYRAPLTIAHGEVPADLLARLIDAESHHSPTTSRTAEGASSANPRPLLSNLEHETGFEPATSTLATWCSTN